MRKRTRIAVIVAALLLGVAGPTVTTAGNRQVAQAGTPDPRAVFRTLDSVIPRLGWTRTGRLAYLTGQQRWRLAKVACTTNKVHDNVHRYERVVDQLLSGTDLPNPYRYQDPVLELSERIYQFKQDAGTPFQVGTQRFCWYAEYNVKLHASNTTR